MYTTWELEEKLRKEGFQEEVVREAIAFLHAQGYLDDQAYMHAYIEEKRRASPRGYFAFLFELKRRGIPGSLLEELRNAYPLEDEVEDAKRLLLAWRASPGEKERARRRLLGRGFSQEAVERAILDLAGADD